MVKKPKKTLTIDITDLFKEYKTPKNMELWDKTNKMTNECKEMIAELSTIIAYVAEQLNDGPEVKESIAKRCMILKSLVSFLMNQTFLDHLHRYGILHQVMNEMFAKQNPVVVIQPEKQSDPKSDKRVYVS